VAALGPIVSAFRTYALLKEHAVLSGKWAGVEAIIGTLFFELAAIVYLMVRLRRLQAKGDMPEISLGWIGIGLFWTIGAVTVSNVVEVSVAALEKAGVVVPAFIPAGLIGIFIGLGVPLCTIVAGETVGRFLLEIQREKQRIREEYKGALAQHEEKFIRSWRSQKGKWLKRDEEIPSQTRKPRSEFSQWTTRDKRLNMVLECVRQLDSGHKGISREQIFELVFNGHDVSNSTKYAAVDDLIADGQLEKVGGLITWVEERPDILPF